MPASMIPHHGIISAISIIHSSDACAYSVAFTHVLVMNKMTCQSCILNTYMEGVLEDLAKSYDHILCRVLHKVYTATSNDTSRVHILFFSTLHIATISNDS